MTKASDVYAIPLPSDAVPKPDSGLDKFLTQSATVIDLTAFYYDYMGQKGWTFEPKYSYLDPNAKLSSVGYTTDQTWCRPTSPITTVFIIVGSGDKQDHGQRSQIIFVTNHTEDSCP